MARRFAFAALVVATAHAAHAQRPASGLELFVQRDKGRCIACHQLPEGVGPISRSDLGPLLEGARMRALGKAGIRQAIVDPTAANPETVMPPFGRHRILDAAEVERLVDFLHALP